MDHNEQHLRNPELILRDLLGSQTALELFMKAGKAFKIEEKFMPQNRHRTFTVNGRRLSYQKIEEMISEARAGRERSYAPYSHFNVGAAVLATNTYGDQRIFNGCNVENAAYSPTFCAECTAAVKAVSDGFRAFLAYAVVGGFDKSMPKELQDAAASEYVTPCGRCRQVTKEFEKDPCAVIVAKDSGQILITTLEFLLPAGFGPRNLGTDASVYSRAS